LSLWDGASPCQILERQDLSITFVFGQGQLPRLWLQQRTK
jgi:hypothetical protein